MTQAEDDDRRYSVHSPESRDRALEAIRRLPIRAGLSFRVTVEVGERHHTDTQRIGIFSRCRQIADAGLPFPGGGRAGAKDWYRFLIGLHRGLPMVRDGNVVVVVGGGLSGATRSEASELISFIEAYAAERGVVVGESC